MESQELREIFEAEIGEKMDGIQINGLHLKYIEWLEKQLKNFNLQNLSNSVCPFCSTKMHSVTLTQYKCKKCNEYFTN